MKIAWYYYRIFSAYLGKQPSQLTFWHDEPQINSNAKYDEIGEYYMPFFYKANYSAYFDKDGIPLLDYRGKVGKQYNPIAVAQYGLGNYNLFKRDNDKERYEKFIKVADWLVKNLEKNKYGIYVWNHHFDWEYKEILKAPWYSALSQGQGISVLVRAYIETNNNIYLESVEKAFETFNYEINEGGVKYTDKEGNVWLEEVIVNPPTHILNGFIWALWGIYDYWLLKKDNKSKNLFDDCVKTLKNNLRKYDVGFWSLYELSQIRLKMLASHFYHKLHIVQLEIMWRLTNEEVFRNFSLKWDTYQKRILNRNLALFYKIIFKLLYY